MNWQFHMHQNKPSDKQEDYYRELSVIDGLEDVNV